MSKLIYWRGEDESVCTPHLLFEEGGIEHLVECGNSGYYYHVSSGYTSSEFFFNGMREIRNKRCSMGWHIDCPNPRVVFIDEE